jgi:hypothetical protein
MKSPITAPASISSSGGVPPALLPFGAHDGAILAAAAAAAAALPSAAAGSAAPGE